MLTASNNTIALEFMHFEFIHFNYPLSKAPLLFATSDFVQSPALRDSPSILIRLDVD